TGSYTLTGLLGLTNLAAPIYTVLPLRNGFVFSPPSILTPPNTANVDFTLVSGFISGRVTDQNNGRPGVIVSAGPGLNATTDANGNYYLSPLPPGNYTLTASLPGYAFSPAQLPNVPIGASQADFNVVGYPVSGRIFDAQSNGVPGVTVTGGLVTNT